MEVNKAPEKIYVRPRCFEAPWPPYVDENSNYGGIEYIRADAFIEKAVEWIRESVTNNPECNRIISKKGIITMGGLIKDFKNYMKGK